MDESYYREELLDHYNNPRNKRDIKDANAVASESNPNCGDKIIVMMKINDGLVEDVSFQGEGCAISMAFASKMTEELKGKKLDEIGKLNSIFALSFFPGQISPARIKCALLGFSTMKEAIDNYEGGNKRKVMQANNEDE